jgi:AcrR family transcriptional regulator
MPKAFTEHEKEIIGRKLLEQGRKHFAAFGLTKTRVEELATAAGISKGAFYLFYESKEALFMEVVEASEREFRQEVLATIERPDASSQVRLFAVLHKAFTLWKTIPILRIFTHAEYAILARRLPSEALQAHIESDKAFSQELIARCQQAGIAIEVQAKELTGLLHALFFASLHEDDFGSGGLTDAIETLLHLTAAYCLGEKYEASH